MRTLEVPGAVVFVALMIAASGGAVSIPLLPASPAPEHAHAGSSGNGFEISFYDEGSTWTPGADCTGNVQFDIQLANNNFNAGLPTGSPVSCVQVQVTGSQPLDQSIGVPADSTLSVTLTDGNYIPPTATASGSCSGGTHSDSITIGVPSGSVQPPPPPTPPMFTVSCVTVTATPVGGQPTSLSLGFVSNSLTLTFYPGPWSPSTMQCTQTAPAGVVTIGLPGGVNLPASPSNLASAGCVTLSGSFNGNPVGPTSIGAVGAELTLTFYSAPLDTTTDQCPSTGSTGSVTVSEPTGLVDISKAPAVPPVPECVTLAAMVDGNQVASQGVGLPDVVGGTSGVTLNFYSDPLDPQTASCPTGHPVGSIQVALPDGPTIPNAPAALADARCATLSGSIANTPLPPVSIGAADATVTATFYTSPLDPTTLSCPPPAASDGYVAVSESSGIIDTSHLPPASAQECVSLSASAAGMSLGTFNAGVPGPVAIASVTLYPTYNAGAGSAPAACSGATIVALTLPFPGTPSPSGPNMATPGCGEITFQAPGPAGSQDVVFPIPPGASLEIQTFNGYWGGTSGGCGGSSTSDNSISSTGTPSPSGPQTPPLDGTGVTCVMVTATVAGQSETASLGELTGSYDLETKDQYTPSTSTDPTQGHCTGNDVSITQGQIPPKTPACVGIILTTPVGVESVAMPVPPGASVSVETYSDGGFDPQTQSCTGATKVTDSLSTSSAGSAPIPPSATCVQITASLNTGQQASVSLGAIAEVLVTLYDGPLTGGASPTTSECTGNPLVQLVLPAPGVPAPPSPTAGSPQCASISYVPPTGINLPVQSAAIPLPPSAALTLTSYSDGYWIPASGCSGQNAKTTPITLPTIPPIPATPVACATLSVSTNVVGGMSISVGAVATVTATLYSDGVFAGTPGTPTATCTGTNAYLTLGLPAPGVPNVGLSNGGPPTCGTIQYNSPSATQTIAFPLPAAALSLKIYSDGMYDPTSGTCTGSTAQSVSVPPSGPMPSGTLPITCVSLTVDPGFGQPAVTESMGSVATATVSLLSGATASGTTCSGGNPSFMYVVPLPGAPTAPSPPTSAVPNCVAIQYVGPQGPQTMALPLPTTSTVTASFYTAYQGVFTPGSASTCVSPAEQTAAFAVSFTPTNPNPTTTGNMPTGGFVCVTLSVSAAPPASEPSQSVSMAVPGLPSQIVYLAGDTPPASTTAGQALTLGLQGEDAYGQASALFLASGSVAFESSDSQLQGQTCSAATSTENALLALSTPSAANPDSFTCTIAFETPGTQTITAQAGNFGALSSPSVQVAMATLLWTPNPPSGPATAGVALSETLKVENANKIVMTEWIGTVTFASTDSQLTVQNYPFGLGDAGQHTFSLAFKTAGSQSLTAASSGVTSGILPVSVIANVATHVVLTAPASVTAGTPFTAVVAIEDAFGNPVSTVPASAYTGSVTITSTAGSWSVSPSSPYKFEKADAGSHNFQVTINVASSMTFYVTATGLPAAGSTASEEVTAS
ncbi:MAG: hypothetical protein ACYDDF_05630 [Thermoplasmatota archaeon]